ncbi:7103_t:CDS:2 [Paraglomus occultum]|uniref:7103_t:CDS:1 n=1 Tax=Paraglomus occultum TaxID=144539 RepID=A0A9N8WM19_9GLOM|nr:7103_t:CDS:2 [Paraglomus occultum]
MENIVQNEINAWSEVASQQPSEARPTNTTDSIIPSRSESTIITQSPNIFSLSASLIPTKSNHPQASSTVVLHPSANTSIHRLPREPAFSHPLDHALDDLPSLTTHKYSQYFSNNSDSWGKASFKSLGIMEEIKGRIGGKGGNGSLTRRRSLSNIRGWITGKDGGVMGRDTRDSVSCGQEENNDEEAKEENTEAVLVHVVKPNDTLAGVALFYGVELQTLKRANKLWTSDSIHTRKHLYIPLDSCSALSTSSVIYNDDSSITILKPRLSVSDLSRPSTSSVSSSPSTPRLGSEAGGEGELSEWSSWRKHEREVSASASTWIDYGREVSYANENVMRDDSKMDGGNTPLMTRAEIQILPVAQLSYFPPHHRTLIAVSSQSFSENSSMPARQAIVSPSTFLDSQSTFLGADLASSSQPLQTPSPLPVAQIYKYSPTISYPLPAATAPSHSYGFDKVLDQLDLMDERYFKRRFGSIKNVFGKTRQNVHFDSGATELVGARERI